MVPAVPELFASRAILAKTADDPLTEIPADPFCATAAVRVVVVDAELE